jgi:hypothetical protein
MGGLDPAHPGKETLAFVALDGRLGGRPWRVWGDYETGKADASFWAISNRPHRNNDSTSAELFFGVGNRLLALLIGVLLYFALVLGVVFGSYFLWKLVKKLLGISDVPPPFI